MRPILPCLIALAFWLCACSRNFTPRTFRLAANGIVENIEGARVNGDFFASAGAKPYLGRFFGNEPSQQSPVTVIVLGYDVWQQRFRGIPDVIGRTVELDGHPGIIVGVAAPSFAPFGAGGIWIPAS